MIVGGHLAQAATLETGKDFLGGASKTWSPEKWLYDTYRHWIFNIGSAVAEHYKGPGSSQFTPISSIAMTIRNFCISASSSCIIRIKQAHVLAMLPVP